MKPSKWFTVGEGTMSGIHRHFGLASQPCSHYEGDTMKKLHPDGTFKDFSETDRRYDWAVDDGEQMPDVFLICECGSEQFKVSMILIDDYA